MTRMTAAELDAFLHREFPQVDRNDYRVGLAPAQAANTPLPSADTLARYRAQPSATRSGALGALVYLRSLPLLRGVARAVPAHWQRRVKNWLQA